MQLQDQLKPPLPASPFRPSTAPATTPRRGSAPTAHVGGGALCFTEEGALLVEWGGLFAAHAPGRDAQRRDVSTPGLPRGFQNFAIQWRFGRRKFIQ